MLMDVWTDMMKLIVAFNNFANVPKNGTFDILVFIYFVLGVYNHVIFMGRMTEFFPTKTCKYIMKIRVNNVEKVVYIVVIIFVFLCRLCVCVSV
jgi:hypothetical protein